MCKNWNIPHSKNQKKTKLAYDAVFCSVFFRENQNRTREKV